MIDRLWQDVRYTVRSLIKAPRASRVDPVTALQAQ